MSEELIKEAENYLLTLIAFNASKSKSYDIIEKLIAENKRLTEALKAKERLTISGFGEFDRTISLQSKQDVNSILGVIELLKMKACCSQNAKSEQQESLTFTGEHQTGEFIIERTLTHIYVGLPRKGESKVYDLYADFDIEGLTYEALQKNEFKAHLICNSLNTRATPDISKVLDSEELVEDMVNAFNKKAEKLTKCRKCLGGEYKSFCSNNRCINGYTAPTYKTCMKSALKVIKEKIT